MKEVQTPLEKLTSEKKMIKELCRVQEEKLNTNVQYIQQNGGKLLLSGLISAILPNTKSSDKNESDQPSSPLSSLAEMALGGASNILSPGKGILPLVWGIAQPFVLTWGIKGFKKLLRGIFVRKKR